MEPTYDLILTSEEAETLFRIVDNSLIIDHVNDAEANGYQFKTGTPNVTFGIEVDVLMTRIKDLANQATQDSKMEVEIEITD